jgi:hypothetical protein
LSSSQRAIETAQEQSLLRRKYLPTPGNAMLLCPAPTPIGTIPDAAGNGTKCRWRRGNRADRKCERLLPFVPIRKGRRQADFEFSQASARRLRCTQAALGCCPRFRCDCERRRCSRCGYMATVMVRQLTIFKRGVFIKARELEHVNALIIEVGRFSSGFVNRRSGLQAPSLAQSYWVKPVCGSVFEKSSA